MKGEFYISAFCFLTVVAVLIRKNYLRKKIARRQTDLQDLQQSAWKENTRTQLQNEELLKSLNPILSAPDDIVEYIRLNRHNFPEEEQWNALLPYMVNDLLAIGWNTHSKIWTKQKNADYQMGILSDDSVVMKNSNKVFERYLWAYELLATNPKYVATNHSDVITETAICQDISKNKDPYIKIEPDIYEELDYDNDSIIRCLEIIRHKLPQILQLTESDIETFITSDTNFLGQEYSLIGLRFISAKQRLNSEDIEDMIYEWMENNGSARKLLTIQSQRK